MLLLLELFLFFVSVRADPHFCSLEEKVLTCACPNNDSVVLSITNEYSFDDIAVKGCGHVELSMAGLLMRHINQLEFLDLHTLVVRGFTFRGVHIMSHITMSNISNLVVKPHGFYGLSNIGSLKLHDVRAERIIDSSFSNIRNISSLEVSGCSFGYVDPFGFSVKNVSSVIIKNSRFENLGNSSIVFQMAGNVSFNNVTIGRTNSSSISVSETKWLSLKQCEFGILAPETFESFNLLNFAFSENLVHEMQNGAFINVIANETVEFQNNTLHVAENNSLSSEIWYTTDTGNALIADNGFDCSCNISWMWGSSVNPAFVASSHCINSGMSLASLSPIFDGGRCLALVRLTNGTVGITESTEYMEEAEHTGGTPEYTSEVNVKPVLSGASRHSAFMLIFFFTLLTCIKST